MDLLRNPFIYTARKQEYVLLGADHNDVGKDLFVLDTLAFNDMVPAPTDPIPYSVEDTSLNDADRKLGAAANLDDDLYDEVVYLTQAIEQVPPYVNGRVGTLHVLDYDDDTGYSRETLTQDLTLPGPSHWYQYDLALGNLDDDPWAEIAVVGVGEGGDARLWVLDDQLAGHALVTSLDILGDSAGASSWTGTEAVRVAIGHVTGDPAPEIVLTIQPTGSTSGTVRIIDDLTATWASLDAYELSRLVSEYTVPTSPTDEFGYWCDVALADLEGDGTAEIVSGCRQTEARDDPQLPGLDYCRTRIDLKAYRMQASGPAPIADRPQLPQVNENTPTCSGRMPAIFEIMPLDIDGDRRDEILADGLLVEYDSSVSHGFVDMAHSVSFFGASPSTAPMHVTVGDANGDEGEDIIMLRRDGAVEVWGLHRTQDGTDMEGNPTYQYNWEQIDDRDGGGPGSQQHGIVVAANLDLDSRVVSPERDPDASDPESSVKSEIVFSDDRIVAVIAAPPCADGIGQNTGNCKMSLGRTSGGSVTTGASFAVWAGVSVGVEAEQVALFATVAKFSAKVAMSAEYATETSTTRSVEHTVSDMVGHGEDLVVFYTVPQKRYTYTVSSHPDQTKVGTEIHVNVPMAPRLFAVTREFYNSNNSGQPDIGSSILPSVPGDLSTYPTEAEADNLLDNHETLGKIGPVTVNQGDSGAKSVEVVVSEAYTSGETVTVSTEAQVEVCGATVCVGAQFGTSGSLYSRSSYHESTTFMASVGSLDAEHWAEHMYDFGLFAYLYDSETLGQTFTVVNAFVD